MQSLVSPFSQLSDGFGASVVMSRSHLVVVDPLDSQVSPAGGVIVVHELLGSESETWSRTAEIRIDGLHPFALDGCSLALQGRTLAVGVQDDSTQGLAAGAVYVFEERGSTPGDWELTARIVGSDTSQEDSFGSSVALTEDMLVVGARFAKAGLRVPGAAYVFRRDSVAPRTWHQEAKLMPRQLENYDWFGVSLDVRRDRIAVGAMQHDGALLDAGAVFVFSRADSEWALQSILTAPDPEPLAYFGVRVLFRGSDLVVSASGDDEALVDGGAVYVFEPDGDDWVPRAKLTAEESASYAGFGASISAVSGTIVVGVPVADVDGLNTGAAYVFEKDGDSGGWFQSQRLIAPDASPHDGFGVVATNGAQIAVGAPKPLSPGSVHVYTRGGRRDPATYCVGREGSVPGCIPQLETLGAPTASFSSTFRIWSRDAPGGQFQVFVYTTQPEGLTDLRSSGVCLPMGAVRRSAIYLSGGTSGACDGVIDIDWNEFGAALARNDPALSVPGTVVHGQFVSFDPLQPSHPAWSDAVAFQLCP